MLRAGLKVESVEERRAREAELEERCAQIKAEHIAYCKEHPIRAYGGAILESWRVWMGVWALLTAAIFYALGIFIAKPSIENLITIAVITLVLVIVA